jgi:aryl-alcohol dehydrogenase-like predicted oxidoreductase
LGIKFVTHTNEAMAERPPSDGGLGSLHLPTRPLGATGVRVTPLALAALAMRAYGPPGLRLEPEDIEAAYHEHGITTFLVHPWFPRLLEGVRRLVRTGHRDRLTLISEVSIPLGPWVRRHWDRLARRLRIDVIDVYLYAWLRARWHLGLGTWAALEALKRAGRVRAIGFSSHNRRLAVAVARERAADVLMIRYNAAHRGAESEVFAALGANRPAIIAYTATRWGLLLKPLPALGFPQAMTAGECYRFVLAQPTVDTVLCAARSRAELRDDVAAALEGPLEPSRLEACRRFGDAVHAAAPGGYRWMFHEAGRHPGGTG